MVIVVCDNGTGFVKIGRSDKNKPEHIFPSIVGKTKSGQSELTTALKGLSLDTVLVGDEAGEKRTYLDLTYPVSHGVIQDWQAMQHLWDYAFFKKLHLTPEQLRESSIMLTEPPLNPLSNREEMVRRMFEEYGFGRVHVATQAVLTLYSQGLTTGLVVDAGDGVTHIVPVYEGYVLAHLVCRLDVAGRAVTERLRELLVNNRGYPLGKTPADLEALREVKEKVCFVSPDYHKERELEALSAFHLTSATMADGKILKLSGERFEAAEILFRPELIQREQKGISEMVFQVIQNADIDLRPRLYEHIILSGGTSMMLGFAQRLQADLERMYEKLVGPNSSKRVTIRVITPEEQEHAVFTGGAVLADLMKDNADFWISREEWNSLGPRKALEKLNPQK